MRLLRFSGPLAVAIWAAFWAYAIMDTLTREFLVDVHYLDLGAIFVLGLISGGSLVLAVALSQKRSATI